MGQCSNPRRMDNPERFGFIRKEVNMVDPKYESNLYRIILKSHPEQRDRLKYDKISLARN